ncbi:hypothetical protein LCGC14_2848450 [marine sediment metagenome]|uniref:Uncharacterized protein n=1 Tax=marine sediment metagenome TaxID=412755 RepID=A0A0F8YVX5_9ZZZZ
MSKRRRLSVDDICMAVSDLSNKERGKVRAACDSLGVDEPSSRSKSIHEEDEKFLLFYGVLIEILREVIGKKLLKSPSHLSPKLYRDLKSGWSTVDDLLSQVKPRARNPQRTKFYRIIVLITIEYIHNLDNVPVGIKTVIGQLQNCAELLHQQFPGYLQAGLISVILSLGNASAIPDDEEL